MRKRVAPAIVCVAVAMAWPLGTQAQGTGQWSWDAAVEAKTRIFDNLLNQTVVSGLSQTTLQVGFGVNGFVVHPAIARFRVGIDTLLTKTGGTISPDHNKWGLRGELALLPRGAYPSRVYFSRQAFSYGDFTDRDPLTLRGVPQTVTNFGGTFRALRGRLRGLSAGFNRNGIASIVDEADQQRADRSFVDWSTGGRRLRHHYRLERRVQDYGAVGYKTTDVVLSASERGFVTQNWRWDLSGSAAFRDAAADDIDRPLGRDTFRVRNIFTREMQGGDLLSFSYDGGVTRPEAGDTGHTHELLGRYLWRLSPAWELGPFASYGLQVTGDTAFSTPQAGAQLGWNHRGVNWGTTVFTRLGAGVYRLTRGNAGRSDPFVSGFANLSVFHGTVSGLRKEIEVEWGRNQLRLIDESVLDLPDLGLKLAGTGTENSARARFTLTHAWRAVQLSGYGEYTRRDFADNFMTPDLFLENVLISTRLVTRRFNIVINAGDASTRGVSSQDIRHAAAAVTFRPWALLSLTGTYRRDFRDLLLAPNIDGRRAELAADVRLGLFILRVRGWMNVQRSQDGRETTNQGVSAGLLRNFAGPLPIFTGTRRRGVVR